jgi:hypothetical protein
MNKKIKQLAEPYHNRIEYDNGNIHESYEFSPDELKEFARLLIIQYNKETKESRRAVKSQLGYSRVGLKNI